MIKRDGFEFRKSTRKNKKYDVFRNNKYVVSFGDKRYQQYKDKIGLYKYLDHNDSVRRYNYYKRFGIESKPFTAKYFSHLYLW